MTLHRGPEDEGIPSIYLDAYHYDLLAQMTAPADLGFYRRVAADGREPVLELACGTGRICLPLRLSGLDVTGLDLSAPLVAAAREKARAAGVELDLVVGDMRRFDLGRTFGLILLPYNSFNHLITLDDVTGCLDSVSRHLDRESWFVIDTFNPDPEALAKEQTEPRQILEYLEPRLSTHVTLYEQTRYDPATQVNHITWRYEVDGEKDVRVDDLSMRIFFPRELDALLSLHGLVIEQKLGDYDGRPFGSLTPKQLVVCRRADRAAAVAAPRARREDP